MRKVARSGIGWLLVALMVAGSGVAYADLPTLVRKKVPPSAKKPPTMNGLARLVTNLEDELKKYGTITVKSPDVWGETTLMSMIQEYERYMRADAGNFQAGMQGFIARADQAALQAQMSMGIAASNAKAAPAAVEPPALGASMFANPPGTAFNMLPSNGVTLSLEPTENTRQHSVYLKVNQALRRTNLGDDNSRQPGYTSYVLRFPVSVLPGRQTHKGCAAVVTIRARLEIDEGHLHETFPRLAISDVAASATPWLLCQWESKPAPASEDTRPKDMLRGGSTAGRVGIATQAVDLHTFKVLYGDDVLRRLLVLSKEQFLEEPKTPELEDFVLMLLTQTQGNLERQGIYEHFAPEVVHLGDAVGRHCLEEIRRIRLQTLERLIAIYDGSSGECPSAGPCDNRCEAEDQAALTWLLLAQSAVLDVNLRRLARAKCGGADDSLHFFLPEGEGYLAAASAWNEMIEEMFPVHVFTLDPVVEEQNYFDAFSRRRELQLAMAMAVAKGEMRAAAAVRFTRQLSLDMLTIGLNRTAVAFAHDNDTFGWYFYPRLQSPPEESSNVAAMARLIWSTGPTRHYDLANRQLEPGMRECEAVIVMPAFVPKLKIDVTTNWERLTKPGSIKVDYVKMINEAAKIQQAVHYAAGVYDQNCYRPEDYEILCSRVDQLEKMLPLQRQYVRLPFPYVLGGKELFDSGNKELPPTLDEFYGLEWLQVYNELDSGNGGPTAGCEADCASAANRSSASRSGGSFDRARSRLEQEVAPTTYEVSDATAEVTQTKPEPGADTRKEDEIYFFLRGRHFHPTQTHVIAGAVKADSVDSGATTAGVGAYATVKVSAPADSTKVPELTVSTSVPLYPGPSTVEVVVLSRELLRVKLKNVTAAHTCGCVHVYVATPAGVSNALRIPLKKDDRRCCPRYPKIDADAPPESKSFSTTKACQEPPHVAPPEEVEYELQERTPDFPPHDDDNAHELPPLKPEGAPPSNRSGAAASRAPQPLAARAVAARPLRTAAVGKSPRSSPKVVQAGAKHPSTLILRSSGDSSTRRIMPAAPRAADE